MTLPLSAPLDDHRLTRAMAMRSAWWAAWGALGRYALAGLTTLALIHLLAPDDFGLIALTIAVQALIGHVIPVGAHDALIQRPRLEPSDLDTAFWSILATAGLTVGLVAVLAAPIAGLFDQPRLAPLLIGMALAALLRSAGTVPRALLNRRLDFKTLTLARLAGMTIGGIVAITLAALGANAWSLIAQIVCVNLVGLLLVWRVAAWQPGRALNRAALRWLWTFAASVSASTILSYVIHQADDQLVGYKLGAEALGFYALAYSFMAWPVRDVLGGVSVVLYPVVSRFQDDLPRVQTVYLESLQLAAAFAFPTLALIAISAPVLIPWLMGARWAPIVLTTQILALSGLREATTMINGAFYRALGKPHLHFLLQPTSAACYLVAFVVGLDYGIAGVAFFYLLTGLLLQPVAWWMLFGILRLRFACWLRALLPIMIVTAIMAVSATVTLHVTHYTLAWSALAALATTGIVALVVYVAGLIVAAPVGVRRAVSGGWSVVKRSALL